MHALDGAVLLFQPSSGTSVRVETDATAGVRRRAPRVVLFSLSHACNLACGFCSRDPARAGRWSEHAAFEALQTLWRAGTLEVSFGGGEPLVHAGFVSLLERLHRHTSLALHFTTNGTRVTPALAERLAPRVGEIRLSAYDDNDWEGALRTLTDAGCRVGVNVMVGPRRLGELPGLMSCAAAAGACDVAVLRYVGEDASLSLGAADFAMLEQAVLAAPLPVRVSNCLLGTMPNVPRLFRGMTVAAPNGLHQDCGAGRDFVVVDPDAGVRSCSFHADRAALGNVDAWLQRYRQEGSRAPSPRSGCARPMALERSSRRGMFVYRSFASNNSGDTLLVARFETVHNAEAFRATLPAELEDAQWKSFFDEMNIRSPETWAGDAPQGLHVHGRTLLATGYDAGDALPGLRQLLWSAGAMTIYSAIHTHDNPELVIAVDDPRRSLDDAMVEHGLESSRRGGTLLAHGQSDDWTESLGRLGAALGDHRWTAELLMHGSKDRWSEVMKHLDDQAWSPAGYLYARCGSIEGAERLAASMDGEVSRAGDTLLCDVVRFRPRLGEFITRQGGTAWWIPRGPLCMRYWSYLGHKVRLDAAALQGAVGDALRVTVGKYGVDAFANTDDPHRTMATMQRLHEAVAFQVKSVNGGVWVGPQQPMLAAVRRVKHELKVLR